MKIHLDNYNLSYSETLFSVLTLTGGTLVKRHWSQSSEDIPVCFKWGHRIIAVIEAIPLLGGLVALIEIVAVNILCTAPTSNNHVDSTPPITSLSLFPHLEFNIPTILTCSQVLALKIRITTNESALPEYADSIFQSVMQIGADNVITRRKKGEEPPLNGTSVQIAPLAGPKEEQSNEGLKVRTFCLELLSNIEDLQMAKQNPLTYEPHPGSTRDELIKIGEIKGIVRYFLELGALQKKAGLSDFTRLMSILAERAKGFLPIFKRYSDLVELQEKLSHKAKGKISRWDKIRAMVLSRLFVRTLVETAEPARKIGLHPIPALPQYQTIVNLYPTIDAINLVESNHRQAGRWLMHHTRVITFRELCQSIKVSCEQLRDSILGWDDYYLLSIKGKSQEWMADIAYRYLPAEKMPKGVLPMDHDSVGKNLFNHIKTNSNNFILFDDGAYSARQFYGYLGSLYLHLTHNGSLMEKKSIYFIFGYFPNDKYIEADFREFETFNVNINIISHILTKNCRALMDEEGLTPSVKKPIEDLAAVGNPQLVTEWKRPDFMSTSLFITEGYLGNYSRARCGELHIADDESVERLHGVGPFTNVVPPYKKAVS